MINREFRYTKNEQLAGIGLLGLFVFLIGLGVAIPFVVKKHTPGDIYATATLLIISFAGILYSIYFWLKRRSFSIKINDDGLIISKLRRTQKIYWKDIKSYVYQSGHPYWFISLLLVNRRRITIHGELVRFDEFIKIIKEKVPVVINKFKYAMRERVVILLFIIILFFNILVITISLVDGFTGRMPWGDAMGIIALFVGCGLAAILQNFRWSLIKFLVTNEGLTMKPWMSRQIFISWSEINKNAETEIKNVRLTLAARVWKLTIKSKDKSISICEDLDNVDELVNIIQNRTGIVLGV